MAAFDGHAAKRQRMDDSRDPAYGGGNYYGNNYNQRGGPGGGRGGYEEKPNHILLITVMNPAYPITTDVIHTISSPSGKVLRIVIFKKNGVQAMVEFDSVEAAQRAKESLNGCDIYSGCCTLKIEFAKPTKLNVYKNDKESWDYTNPNLGKAVAPGGDRPALLQEPPRGYGSPGGPVSPYGEARRGQQAPMPAYNDGYDDYMPRGPRPDPYGTPPRDPYGGPPRDPYGGPPRDPYGAPPPERYGNGRDPYARGDGPHMSHGGPGYGPGVPLAPPGSLQQQNAVMMVYGVNHEKMNCDKLFNILCLYGNVVKIKYLKSKEGCAMVQMGDPLSVERCVSHLNRCAFFDSELQLGYSKQPFLNDVPQPFELPDGSPSFKNYMGNRNNRFSNPEAAKKNRIVAPSKLLHFFNAPVGIPEEEIIKVFEEHDAKPPSSVKPIQSRNKQSERSSTGMLEFDSTSDALEGLALVNHVQIPNPNGKLPYTFKLCFSSTRGPRGDTRPDSTGDF